MHETVEGLLTTARAVVLHTRPVDVDPTVIGQLATSAATTGVVVAVPFVHRYYPMVRLARRRVRSGTPGPLHLLHGWSAPHGVAAWCDLVEFTSRHRITRLSSTCVDSTGVDPDGDAAGSPGAMALMFETDRGAVGTLAVSQTRPVEGGTLLAAFDGVDESIVFHEGRPEVLDVMGRRSAQRYQRGIGSDVSRYSTQPAGHPQGHRDCWASFIADAHSAARGHAPDGLPTLVDLARSASIAAAVRESLSTSGWARVSSEARSGTAEHDGRKNSVTLEAQVLGDKAVRAADGGYEVDLHLAWYRSLPLSCLEGIDLTINNETATRESLKVAVGDQQLGLDDLPELDDEWWFVQDALTVHVPSAAAAAQGEQVDVDVTLATRVPYIIIGPDTALVQRTHVVKKVVVQ